MNNIITLGEFVNILKKTDFFKDRTDSEQIVLVFFQSIADALKNEDTVSIKGLGDFTVVSRDSGLILFTPDRTMADTINEPFAFFEPIELADVITDEMLDNATNDIKPGEVKKTEETGVEIQQPVDTTETTSQKEPAIDVLPESDKIEAVQESESFTTETNQPVEPEKPVTSAVPEQKPIETIPVQEPEKVTEKADETASTDKVDENVIVPVTDDNETPPEIEEDDTINEDEEEQEYITPRRGHSTFALVAYTLLGIAIGFVIGLFTAEYIFADDEEDESDEIELVDTLDEENFTAEETTSLQESIDSALESTSSTGNDKVVEETQTAPIEPKTAAVVTDTVRANHYLTHMSRRFYGGATEFWVYIYLENQDKLGHPDRLSPNTVVVIPPAEKYGIDPNNPESKAAAKRKAAEIYAKFK